MQHHISVGKLPGQNATRRSRGRRTQERQSGPRPSGSQLARSWLWTPALNLKRRGRTHSISNVILHMCKPRHFSKPLRLLKTCHISHQTYSSFPNSSGMFRSSMTVSSGRTPSMLCRSIIILNLNYLPELSSKSYVILSNLFLKSPYLQRVEEIKNKRQAHHIFQRMKLAKKIQKAKDIKEVLTPTNPKMFHICT